MFQRLLALAIRSGTIYQIRLPDGEVEPFHVPTGPYPDGLVLTGNRVFWTTMGAPTRNPGRPGQASLDYSARNGGLHVVDADGSNPRELLSGGAVTTPKQLAWDDKDTLYFGDREGCRVSRVRTDGTGLTDLVVNPDRDLYSQCVGVAVDLATGHLYWSQKGPAKAGKGRIFRVPLDTEDDQPATERTDIELLWSDLPEPIDLQVFDGHLYWTDRGAPPGGNTLNRAPLPPPGSTGAAPAILASGFADAVGLAVDGEAGTVYVGDRSGRIRAVPIPGTSAEADRVIVSLGEPLAGIAGSVTDAD